MKLVFKAVWLSSNTCFFNNKTNLFSTNINDVIDYKNIEFDDNGLVDYLDFGYSVFGQTPLKNIKFLRPTQSLYQDKNGNLIVKKEEDSIIDELNTGFCNPSIFFELFHNWLNIWHKSHNQEKILIPTSGGYDSRLLNYFYPDKSKIIACTYGISAKQNLSFEVINAKSICKKLGIDWMQIQLGKFHQHIPDWNSLFGPSVHAHGMYQWEFFTKIKEKTGVLPMLSGIAGDAWAGALDIRKPKHPNDLVNLGLNHGIKADSSTCYIKSDYRNRALEFDSEKERLEDPRYRVLYLIQTKMILLSYLLSVPRSIGFDPDSPFIDLNIVLPMLRISENQKKNRKWQTDFMVSHGLDVEKDKIARSFMNDLNLTGLLLHPLPPLNNCLKEIFKSDYIDWINRNINERNFIKLLRDSVYRNKIAWAILRRMNISNTTVTAYNAYLLLKPLEFILMNRKS